MTVGWKYGNSLTEYKSFLFSFLKISVISSFHRTHLQTKLYRSLVMLAHYELNALRNIFVFILSSSSTSCDRNLIPKFKFFVLDGVPRGLMANGRVRGRFYPSTAQDILCSWRRYRKVVYMEWLELESTILGNKLRGQPALHISPARIKLDK